ncbi:MAG: nucleoside deaminase [Xanthomonadales bacterium]|nr:nucleoside deaminase [Xanthomonadales bacterium]
MSLKMVCEVALPAWLDEFVSGWKEPLATVEQRMRLAVALSAENVRRHTGGPFGAIVVEEPTGRLLAVGVNLVTTLELSMAHAEMVAVSLAQSATGNWHLGAEFNTQLVTSCEPCAMCFGAVPWSGVRSIVWGAGKEDAEAAGFDEGDKPSNWIESLERRGISAQGGVLRREAAAVLSRYAKKEGAIYHPEKT